MAALFSSDGLFNIKDFLFETKLSDPKTWDTQRVRQMALCSKNMTLLTRGAGWPCAPKPRRYSQGALNDPLNPKRDITHAGRQTTFQVLDNFTHQELHKNSTICQVGVLKSWNLPAAVDHLARGCQLIGSTAGLVDHISQHLDPGPRICSSVAVALSGSRQFHRLLDLISLIFHPLSLVRDPWYH